MANIAYTTTTVPFSDNLLNGGLNSTAGPLGLANNESSDLQNIDFNKFGSILKRNGYTALNSTFINGTATFYGLHWFEYDKAGTLTREAVAIHAATSNNCDVLKMDNLDGTWDDVSGPVTISNNFVDFTNFLNECYMTAKDTPPFKYTGGGASLQIATPSNLQWAKFNEEFNNYLFLANAKVENTHHNSRVYWSTIKNTGSWTATNFIDVAKDDGQEITRIKKLGDRLVIYKTRSIYNLFFTGEPDVPFILPGGGKSNSPVGCVAPFSVQEVDNGHVFLSYDGFYFYDGINSFKISDKVTSTLDAYEDTRFEYAPSMVQKSKNRYWCGFTLNGQTENSRILVWDYFNNAWSVYTGLAPSSMATFYVSGVEERPYFSDYDGYVYRGDNGDDDYPLNTQTAISAYYYTNWRHYQDLVDQKGISNVYLYHQLADTSLTYSYSYDFETGDTYSKTIDLSTSGDAYGTALYGTAVYAGGGGKIARVDLTGRGRLVRYKFTHNSLGEGFQIDGFGSAAYLETRK